MSLMITWWGTRESNYLALKSVTTDKDLNYQPDTALSNSPI